MAKKNVKKFQEDVPLEKSFWVHNGPVLRNLWELVDALKNMKNETFLHHVNKEKNDFYNWIKDGVGDNVLANAIKGIKKKNALLKKLKDRIDKPGR